MYKWNAKDYAQNSRGQEAWGRELLSLCELRADDVILDIGCGDGRNTAFIAQNVPQGRVVGVDLSADMVAHAATQHTQATNLRFAQADAAALPFDSEFSLVFSNATLHWIPNQRAAVQGIARALRPGGRFVAQMGGRGNVADVAAAFDAVLAHPRWQAVNQPVAATYRFQAPEDYQVWLAEVGMSVDEARLIPKDMVHDDAKAFIGWLRTAWHPYTAGIPAEVRDAFIDETAQHFMDSRPPDAQGRIHVAAVRLQVRARKPG